MTTAAGSKKKAPAGVFLVSADRVRWEQSGSTSDARAVADEFAKSHKLKDGFVFVHDADGREQRFRVLSRVERKAAAKGKKR